MSRPDKESRRERDQRHLTGTEPRNGSGSIRSIGVAGHLRVYRQAAARRVSLGNEHLANELRAKRVKHVTTTSLE